MNYYKFNLSAKKNVQIVQIIILALIAQDNIDNLINNVNARQSIGMIIQIIINASYV